MKVLDASLLIDYIEAHEGTEKFYQSNGGESQRWVIPAPAYAEVLAGVGNVPDGDVADVRANLAWAETHAIDEQTAVLAGEIADEVGRQGPFLDGPDALIAAVGRELDAPVVSADSDLTHEATKRVVDVEEYRD